MKDLIKRIENLTPQQYEQLKLRLKEKNLDIPKEIASKVQDMFSSIPAAAERDYYPLSSAQKRLYILNQLEGALTSYNVPGVMLMEGALDRERLENAFGELVRIHEAFRTSFQIIDNEPVQYIHKTVGFKMHYDELDRNQVAGEKSINEKISEMIRDFIRPFDLNTAPLLRVKLVRISSEKHVLMYDMHHIIADATSLAIFQRELADIYRGKTIPALKVQYKDFSEWQNKMLKSPRIKQLENFWLEKFSGEIPILDLPADFQRPLHQSFEGDVVRFEAEQELAAEIKALSANTGTTAFMVLLSAFYILLSRYSGQEDIIIGTPVSGRTNPDIKEVIGMFVNTLPLLNHVGQDMTFVEFLGKLKANLLDAYENQDYQFEMLVEKLKLKRDLSRGPLIDVMFVMQNIGDSVIEMKDLRLSPLSSENKISKFDATLVAKEVENKICFGLEYCTRLFRRDSILRLSENYLNILKIIVKKPHITIRDIDILTTAERHRLLYQFNATTAEYQRNIPVHRAFEKQALAEPERIALVCRGRMTTYGELNLMADGIASALREKGIRPGAVVGLMADRSKEMLAGIIGILKAGGAYLPLDPAYPGERIEYMLEDSKVGVILTQEAHRDKAGSNVEIINLMEPELCSKPRTEPEVAVKPEDLAYIIYTSGSTGRPKGVMIEHGAIVNFIKGMTDTVDFSPEKAILALTTVSFDIFLLETLLPLSLGMRIVMADENEQVDPRLLNKLINGCSVNMLQMTPSRLQLFMAHRESTACLSKLNEIIIGGEAFPQKLLEDLKQLTAARIYNVYGPTETTVWSAIKELTGSSSVTVGKPIANTGIYILDKNQKLQPIGVYGELCIGGHGLARGYWNRPDLTNEKFVRCLNGQRVYRTGDIARWLSNGELEIAGRMDHQVKLRGYRIELEEIESCLLECRGIKEAAAAVKEDGSGNKYLAAYLVMENEEKISELREQLMEKLPEYMVPSYYVPVNKLPETLNGKIDRNALPVPDMGRQINIGFEPPQTGLEQQIAQIWGEVLRVDRIGANDNFFELGGDSIKALQVSIHLHKLGLKAEIRDVFQNPSVRSLSRAVRIEDICAKAEKGGDRNHNMVSPEELGKIKAMLGGDIESAYPLSYMQEGILFHLRLTNDPEAYVEQMSFSIHGSVDLDIFKKSLEILTKRHDVLRTNFVYERMAKPRQVVYKEKTLFFNYEDISDMDESEKLCYLEHYKLNDRRRGFNLIEDMLMRVSILRLKAEKFRIIWTRHHIIMDGWCMTILIREFLVIYSSLVNVFSLKLNKVFPYSSYIKWIHAQDREEALKYWAGCLAGYTNSPALPKKTGWESVNRFEVEEYAVSFDSEITEGLKDIAKSNGVTLNTIFQAIWGILLQWYNSTDDVVFGAVVSGRPSEIEGIENMVGVFVNTLPVRVKCDSSTKIIDLIRQLQSAALTANRYEYVSLADIQAKTSLKNSLFDNIVVFENYPEINDSNLSDMPIVSFNADEFEGFEKSNYYFNVIVQSGNGFMVKYGYNSLVYSRDTVIEIHTRLKNIAKKIVENPETLVRKLDIYTDEEKNNAMKEYNQILSNITMDNSNIKVEFDI